MKLFDSNAGGTVRFSVRTVPALLVQGGLAGAEEAPLTVFNGSSYQNFTNAADVAQKLTATVKQIRIDVPGDFQMVVPDTAGQVTLALYQPL